MERSKEIIFGLNEELDSAFYQWKNFPDEPTAVNGLNGAIKHVAEKGLGLTIAIEDKILRYSESRRAFPDEADLKLYFRREGKLIVSRLQPRRGLGEISVAVMDLWKFWSNRGKVDTHNLVMFKNEGDSKRIVGIFRPTEINSISVTK